MVGYDVPMEWIYLDNNATTAPAPEVIEMMERALREHWANPSSVHRFGQQVRSQLELARHEIASLLGCRDREIIFTSGATEANNLALRGLLALRNTQRQPRPLFITSATEHSAIREPGEALTREGLEVITLPVSRAGLVDPAALDALLAERGQETALVSIHWANNETGVIQPISELTKICHQHHVPFHTDATQAVGKIPVDLAAIPVDALSFAGHKFHGPKGSGGLFLRATTRLRPQILGGPQERERRGGTENIPAILGLGVAARLARDYLASDAPHHLSIKRDRFESEILDSICTASVNGAAAPRLDNTTNIAFPPLEAEAILLLLSERGICASAGAACSSGSLEPSPVLLAMGLPEPAAHGSVRFSLSRYTTDDELEQAIRIVPEVIARLRESMPG